MASVPLKAAFLEEGVRPRDWEPRRRSFKIPFRLLRLCVLGTFLPALLVTGPIYLRYHVYSDQLYPLAASDQRLIDGKVSTTWCQTQLVKVNGTFNAYLLDQQPEIKAETVPVTMTRHLVLEDDMKEYWGFYLLRGSSVTVSTCVRWPGASLTIIRGHRHLHECAFIGDDSSEELEELYEIAQEQGLINPSVPDGPSNEPEKMERVRVGVKFHDESRVTGVNHTLPASSGIHQLSSHELDAQQMRNILTQLFAKTLLTKNKQKETPHHHYEGTYRESSNIDRPPTGTPDDYVNLFHSDELPATQSYAKQTTPASPIPTTVRETDEEMRNTTTDPGINSGEVFKNVLSKLRSLGSRGKTVLQDLMAEIGPERDASSEGLRRMVNDAIQDDGDVLTAEERRRRRRREVILSSPLNAELNEDDADGDAAVEEGMLNPDGIAEDRGTVNETTMNDRSNSEFWSSFSSSEERLLECNGLILNLPLTPHRHCTPKFEGDHVAASLANTVTYRVPSNGYYFFVFNSENEIQPNFIRIRFELEKTSYDTSNPMQSCKNSTGACSLPLSFFSTQKAVLELPLTGNESQWNEEYVVVSTCEPRTAIYVVCIVSVPILVLVFAFH
ncbi:uncharacterized protein LOC124305099 [Neodiprion virginianus]|uniref:uncharacterized protein LOC124305099 n=1 Tax=Neodiprion virginianus TaxID=2961670 RepID=UPI001EE6E023|nr:uncharacterized protein LOC124305099 [Neodiprion virginianus]XP_046620106.1 uncharacterized protein LOC124305099 [Neodiprion virginianus]